LAIRPERELEIVDELAQQLEAAYEAAERDGASPEAAAARAVAEVPDWQALARTLTAIERSSARQRPRSHTRSGGFMGGFAQDLRHATRMLWRTPGHAGAAILTLALGLGLGAAAFALIDGILLRPLPYERPDRLVLIKATVPREARLTPELTLPDVWDLAGVNAFAEVAVVIPYAGTTSFTDPPSRIEGFEVSPGLFTMLGLQAPLGRVFTSTDADPASAPVAMISFGLWQRLGAPANIIGQAFAINEVPRTIVGVAPAGFRIELMSHPSEVFVPVTRAHPLANRAIRAFRGIARLRDDVSLEEAGAAVATLGASLSAAFPDTNGGRSFSVHGLRDEIVADVRSQLWLVATLVVLVLLVAIVNLAGLQLTRTAGRLRDVAVRLALGASRWRMARESIAEGLVIAAGGAALGSVIGAAALNVLRTTKGLTLPRLSEVSIDQLTILAIGIAATVVACGAGLIPLFLMQRLRSTATLRTGHETAGRPALRMRAGLIVGQTGFAFLLLSVAVLLAVNLRSVLSRPLGFETSNIVTLRLAVPETRYPTRESTAAFVTEILDTLRAQPSVVHAGLVSNLPLAGTTGSTLSIRGREDVPMAMRPTVGWNWASPGYFAAMGMPLLAGRDFTGADVARDTHVTVINETLARLHFPGENPIGQRVYFGGFGPGGPPEWHEIIGVVGNVRHRQIDGEPDARAYDLFGQHWGRTVSLAIRTADRPLQVAGLVRQLLSSRDPRLAVFQVRTTADLVSDAVASRRLLLLLVTLFAVSGLAVALIGLYGTVSYSVAQRTHEVGIRVALGATAASIRRDILARGLTIVAVGVGAGLAGLVVLRPVIDAQLSGMTAMNGPALVIAALALMAAATGACLVPARRAVKIDPVEALRVE
jgi:putative ABC transport system permease protein